MIAVSQVGRLRVSRKKNSSKTSQLKEYVALRNKNENFKKGKMNTEIKLHFIQYIQINFNVPDVIVDHILHSVHSIQKSRK